MLNNFIYLGREHKKVKENDNGYLFAVYSRKEAVDYHVFLKRGTQYPLPEDLKEKVWAWGFTQYGPALSKLNALKNNPLAGVVRTASGVRG